MEYHNGPIIIIPVSSSERPLMSEPQMRGCLIDYDYWLRDGLTLYSVYSIWRRQQDLQNTRVNLLMDKKGSETITSKSGDVRITTLDGQNSLLADYLGCLLLTK
ncbi:hypothetical protein DTO271D3_557 [Paecilomyces variotii]|nr:hypothetical protein DTO169E5_3012 [Paecilomyces variotii]KAJ9246880.1 hypothetical protein DTO207G8_8555 [Paecilomyces variotii]KAJ9305631.1 hypothetical protein DTO217A2_4860 [Paecilomyces variotii]KAJ9318969.1 hypothetical protein DTO271D3_557 [Paecilomyces variotii]KAJ9355463.1 hypothetical protein DTO280E4_6415 [Paecilomyces variotii]